MEVFRHFSMPFNVAMKEMLEMTVDQSEMCQTHIRQYRQVGKAFLKVGQALEQDGRKLSLKSEKCVIDTLYPSETTILNDVLTI